MRFKKKIKNGDIVELEIIKVKDCPRAGLYDVYKVKGDKTIYLYRETYTNLQLEDIKRRGYFIEEEPFC